MLPRHASLIPLRIPIFASRGTVKGNTKMTPTKGTTATRVIFDTDAGVDDILALTFLLSLPLESGVILEAVTVSYGIAHQVPGVRNVLGTLSVAGRSDVPVYVGRDSPLTEGATPFPKYWREASDGLSGIIFGDRTSLTNPPEEEGGAIDIGSRIESTSAEDYLRARLGDVGGEPVTLLATGAMTTLAQVLGPSGVDGGGGDDESSSDVVSLPALLRIVIMGGAWFFSLSLPSLSLSFALSFASTMAVDSGRQALRETQKGLSAEVPPPPPPPKMSPIQILYLILFLGSCGFLCPKPLFILPIQKKKEQRTDRRSIRICLFLSFSFFVLIMLLVPLFRSLHINISGFPCVFRSWPFFANPIYFRRVRCPRKYPPRARTGNGNEQGRMELLRRPFSCAYRADLGDLPRASCAVGRHRRGAP